jgi:hypothetical protein
VIKKRIRFMFAPIVFIVVSKIKKRRVAAFT